jgi:hypothetical protein
MHVISVTRKWYGALNTNCNAEQIVRLPSTKVHNDRLDTFYVVVRNL